MSEKNEYLIAFAKPFTFEGKEYKTLDLSGLDSLTSEQFFEVSHHFSTKEYITPRPEADVKYCCMLAAEVSGKPLDFFNALPIREVVKVRNAVQTFFQSEG